MNILTDTQRLFLDQFKSSALNEYFYFTNGTALSEFYLKHRYSHDLDFFTKHKEALDINTIISFLKSLPHIRKIKYEKIYDRRLFFLEFANDSLKVEFSFYPFEQINKCIIIEGLRVDSFDDLFVNKIAALIDRDEEKDLIDLYFILKSKDESYLFWGLEKVKEKFGIDGAQYIIQRKFANVPENLENVPYLIKPLEYYKQFFEQKAIQIAKKFWK